MLCFICNQTYILFYTVSLQKFRDNQYFPLRAFYANVQTESKFVHAGFLAEIGLPLGQTGLNSSLAASEGTNGITQVEDMQINATLVDLSYTFVGKIHPLTNHKLDIPRIHTQHFL